MAHRIIICYKCPSWLAKGANYAPPLDLKNAQIFAILLCNNIICPPWLKNVPALSPNVIPPPEKNHAGGERKSYTLVEQNVDLSSA